MLRRHPILTISVLLICCALVAVAVFIATFDLNRHRTKLQAELSSAISQPVQLGEARFSLRHGPAFDFADLRIGAGEGNAEILRAEHLFLKLELMQLLVGKLTFSKILLDSPTFIHILQPPVDQKTKIQEKDKKVWAGTLVRDLEIQNGTIQLIDRRDPKKPYTLMLEGLEAQIANPSLTQTWEIWSTGRVVQEGEVSPFTIAGEITLEKGLHLWHEMDAKLDLALQDFTPEPLLKHFAAKKFHMATTGRHSLLLKIWGSPADELRFKGNLSSENLEVHLPDISSRAFPLKELTISGAFSSDGKTHKIPDLEFKIEDFSLTGDLTLQDKAGALWLEGDFASSKLPLSRLDTLLPPEISSPEYKEKDLLGGTLQLTSAHFAGPLLNLARLDKDFPLQEAYLSLENGRFQPREVRVLENCSFIAHYKNQKLALTNGMAYFLDSPFQFSGTTEPFQKDPKLNLEMNGVLLAKPLLQLFPEESRKDISAHGSIPISLALDGNYSRLGINMRADLQDLAGKMGNFAAKPDKHAGSLFLSAEITPDAFKLIHSRLHIDPLEIRAKGHMERQGKAPFKLVVDAGSPDMQRARALIPFMGKLNPRGQLDLHYEISGAQKKILQRKGTVSLLGFGIHLTHAIADINDATGKVLLFENKAEIESMEAKLGTSPLAIEGMLSNFADPRIDLKVTSDAIRADHIIFRSDTAYLRNVDSTLRIDKTGVYFEPVNVRLEGGTRASVKGAVKDFGSPKVLLDIEASYGNIDEVIALWQGPQYENKDQSGQKTKRRVLVRISAKAREGTIGGMRFQNAQGIITHRDRLLSIYPLTFHVGAGTCSAQVLSDSNEGSPALLKISGHAENVDAYAVYKELLKRRGLITGNLSGDFYLEGRVGKNFLPTSVGGFSIKVKEGILHKFNSLSKVFSLLNVSQILTFKLPDMSSEGMPFERLDSTFNLREGVLTTEDLFIKSNAMNLSTVGSLDLKTDHVDMTLGLKPLRTVDRIITNIPLAGWILAGEEKALITAHFQITGPSQDPDVVPVPITSVSEKVLGIFKRTLGLPGKLITDVGKIFEGAENPQKD